jgi:uncharacterized protein
MVRFGVLAVAGIVAGLGLMLSPASAAPSFSCDGDLNVTEAVICSDEGLSRLDVRLTQAFQAGLRRLRGEARADLQAAQTAWRARRDECRYQKDCIRNSYTDQLEEVRAKVEGDQQADTSQPVQDDKPESVMALGHNGSTVQMRTTGDNRVEMRYTSVRPGIPAREGALLFRGTTTANGRIRGTAYVFKRGCPPAGYEVSGEQTNSRIVLHGAAPVHGDGCDIIGYDASSHNARLEFTIAE